MHTYDIYLEEADSDEPRKYLGTLNADTMGHALQKASEYYEVPSYDLVAIQKDKDSIVYPINYRQS